MKGCKSGKDRYKTEDDALKAMRRIRSWHSERERLPGRVYHCHLCNGFHMTSKNPNQGKKERVIRNVAFKRFLNKQ
jgi:hypothetical protein